MAGVTCRKPNFGNQLLVDFVLGNEVAFSIESTDNVFVALEGEVRGFALRSGVLHRERTVFVLHGSDGVTLFVLLVVGIVCSERIGARPEFNSVEDEEVHEADTHFVNRNNPQQEVDARVEPLVAQGAVPAEELLGEAIATVAAREDENASAEQSDNCFLHSYKLLIFRCLFWSLTKKI